MTTMPDVPPAGGNVRHIHHREETRMLFLGSYAFARILLAPFWLIAGPLHHRRHRTVIVQRYGAAEMIAAEKIRDARRERHIREARIVAHWISRAFVFLASVVARACVAVAAGIRRLIRALIRI